MFKRDYSGRFIVKQTSWERNKYQFLSEDFQMPTISETDYQLLSETDYQQLLQRQENRPVSILQSQDKTWWMFKWQFYLEDEFYRAEEVKGEVLELEIKDKFKLSESQRIGFFGTGERLDERMGTDFLKNLPIDDVKAIVSIRTQIFQNLNEEAKKEYDDWVIKGKSAVQKASKELLKPGEDIRQLEQFMGKIPADFIGTGSFESSPIYKKWRTCIENAKKRLENAKKIIQVKVREQFGFPDIPAEQEELPLAGGEERTAGGRDTMSDDVKIYVWQRDSGKCVKCGS